jgi:hypothetical protein
MQTATLADLITQVVLAGSAAQILGIISGL